eukprot:6232317-Prymnesium_polylepis.1
MSRMVLTWWPTWDGSSFALSHAMLGGPSLPDSAHMSRSRSGRLGGMCRQRGRDGCACGWRACARRPARGVADLRQVRSRARAP